MVVNVRRCRSRSAVCVLWWLMSTLWLICNPTTISFSFLISSRISAISIISPLFSRRRSSTTPESLSPLITLLPLSTRTPPVTSFPSRFNKYMYLDGTCPNSATAVPLASLAQFLPHLTSLHPHQPSWTSTLNDCLYSILLLIVALS